MKAVHHIDGDTQNNDPANIRIVDVSESLINNPYTVTVDNLKRGVFKDCSEGRHDRCQYEITHRYAQPQAGIWNQQCTCECHPTAFGDDSGEEL